MFLAVKRVSNETRTAIALFQSIRLLPQQVCSESPESTLDSLLALRVRRDSASTIRRTTREALQSQHSLLQAVDHVDQVILPSSPPKSNPPAEAKK